jgi:hypothetical protein
MTNLEYISQQLDYAEEQLALADSMSERFTWGNRCDALEAAYMDEMCKHVSEDARNSIPQVLTINYN